MQFIFLVFINIIMATIFYLFLKLKIERYASSYKEKRLKREIDEIIYEFNETAERNITILDNRISSLKQLLEKAGTINNINISVDDNEGENKNLEENNIKNIYKKENEEEMQENVLVDNGLIVKTMSKLKTKIINIYNTLDHKDHKSESHKIDKKIENDKKSDTTFNSSLEDERGNSEIVNGQPSTDLQENEECNLTEIQVEKMFLKSEDKYRLIYELYNKGYTAEFISQCSGIPSGEIKLVLDINNW